ncbi:MAG TPA: ATP-binding cassette domain-containing protein, partial [Saprospiraceae bacterium]|nr:ATP-binding cassette domain-containing protein [Saprospiraceae bacterium]
IKLQGSQQKRRMKWASIQAKLFRVQMKSLTLTQVQDGGALLINQLKDIFISIVAALEVVEGRMTLGMLLAVQYIIGQLNGPIQQMIGFIRSAQDAKISLDRLSEVNDAKDEEDPNAQNLTHIPEGAIEIKNVSFKYTEISDLVLDNVSITIPRGKTTAIVGASGSGKTTLVKLLLRFYPIHLGSISVGGIDLQSISLEVWRSRCGGVLQDGFLFSDTIANNIAESDDATRLDKVMEALQLANITDFIQDLPLQANTMIGAKGNGVSQGQKQRIHIARALYKNPDFLFFDEATNSLDATNEKEIVENINAFTKGKTTVIVAHRLSTVKNADQIIVLDKGKVVEIGNHVSLVASKGYYYRLVSDQLSLGQ